MDAFLTVTEFEGLWRPLTPAQKVFAELALGVASGRVRERKPGIPDGDAAAKLVVHDMVKTAIVTGRYPGHSSYQETAGGSNLSGSLAVIGGALKLTDEHLEMLGVPVKASPQWTFGDCE